MSPLRASRRRLAAGGLVGILVLAGLLPLPTPAPVHAAPADPDVAKARESLEKFAKEPFEQKAREAALRALGRVGGAEAAALVATVLDDPFVHLHDHGISAWIEMAKGVRGAESVAWLARDGLHDRRSPSVRRGAAVALGVAGGDEGGAALLAALPKEGDAGVLAAIAAGIGRRRPTGAPAALAAALGAKDPEAADAVARALGACATDATALTRLLEPLLAGANAPLLRAGAIDGLATGAPARLAAAVSALVGDKALEPKIALADALGALAVAGETAAALRALASLLEDASFRVRAAAYEGALGIWSKEAIPVLVERFGRETGRLRQDAWRTLRVLAGEDVGPDPSLWKAWFATKGPTLDLGPRPAPDAYGRIRRASPPATAAPGETKTAAFFALPLVSERLAFLFDFSGSMRDPVEGDGEGTKAELARREFGKAVAALGKGQVYDLFIYRYPSAFPPAPKLTRAIGALAPGGDASAKKAVAWLAKEEPKGWGAFYDALVALSKEDVDTIVLLSDGVPSRGTYDRDVRLLAEFAKANRFRRVAVDTVLVGRKGSDRVFLETLSDVTGGRFRDATSGGTKR